MRTTALLAVVASASLASANIKLNQAPPEAFKKAKEAGKVATEAFEEATSSAESLVQSVTQSFTEKPTHTPYVLKAPFFEQFDDDSRWKRSNAKKDMTDAVFDMDKSVPQEEWEFIGTWANEEPSIYPGFAGDKGLVLKDKAAHHAISAQFDKPISNKDKTLVVQYEVKLQNGLECGGAYMKLLQDNKELKTDEFSNATPYIIMFGPDKCGSTNKVHFIFRHKNPKTGEYEEKHLLAPPRAEITKISTLYTLIVQPDQTFEILINGKSEKIGSLLEDFDPPVNPDKEIDDPDDEKPADWIDDERIPDPKAKKPADWDETAPLEIPDKKAKKPADWLDDEPAEIPDPDAPKPVDWDDEEDGDWIAPTIPNPKCADVSGCGPWKRPLIRNPDYKGEWIPGYIDNPNYKGDWTPRRIPNPDYYEDKTPANFEPMGAIGFELWTMQNDILFDNIYIGHSIADALALQKDTFDIKFASEEQQEAADTNEEEEDDLPTALSDLNFLEDPMEYLKTRFDLFVGVARRDPLDAIKKVPEISAIVGVGLATLVALLLGAIGGGAKAIPEDTKAKAKDAVKKAADDVSKSVSSGVDQAKDEINKRTTRSST